MSRPKCLSTDIPLWSIMFSFCFCFFVSAAPYIFLTASSYRWFNLHFANRWFSLHAVSLSSFCLSHSYIRCHEERPVREETALTDYVQWDEKPFRSYATPFWLCRFVSHSFPQMSVRVQCFPRVVHFNIRGVFLNLGPRRKKTLPFFVNPFFAISTSIFSKLRETYTMSCRSALSSTLLNIL
jgi:hypothetical protein